MIKSHRPEGRGLASYKPEGNGLASNSQSHGQSQSQSQKQPAAQKKAAGFLLTFLRNKRSSYYLGYIILISNFFLNTGALALELSSANYKISYVEFLSGGGATSSSNFSAKLGQVGGVGATQGLSGTNFSLKTGQIPILVAALLDSGKLEVLSDLNAWESPLGAPIPEELWQKDNDPYFTWSIRIDPPEIVEGSSVSLDTEPDFIVDTTETSYQADTDALVSGQHIFYVLPHIQTMDWDRVHQLQFNIWVDLDPPTVNQLSPYSGQIVTDNLTPISCQAIDAHSGFDIVKSSLSINESAVNFVFNEISQILTYTPSSPLSEGKISLLVNAYDLLGNSIVKGWDFILDSLPVAGAITINGGEEYAHSPYVLINIDAQDEVSGPRYIYLSNDGVFDSEMNQPYAFTSVIRDWLVAEPDTEGVKTIYARLEDYAGNISDPVEDSISLKLLTPDTRIIAGPQTITESTGADFRYDGSVLGCSFSYKLDSSDWSSWSTDKETGFSGLLEGNHYFFVKSALDLNSDGEFTADEEDPTASMWVWTIKPEGAVEKLRKRILFWRR